MRTGVVTTVVGISVAIPKLLSILYGLPLVAMLSEDGVHGGATLVILKVWLTLLYFCFKGCRTPISWNSRVLIPEVEEIPEFKAFI